MKLPTPTEDQEQRTVCEWLDLHGITYCHVPNGGSRRRVEAAIFAGIGVKPGVPDLLIFDPSYAIRGGKVDVYYHGAAVEMKRRGREKEKDGGVTDDQRWWLERLKERNWAVTVAYGASEAIDFLESLGYGKMRVG